MNNIYTSTRVTNETSEMMNQLPYELQLIVYKYLHVDTLANTYRDMMIQLRSERPYLRFTQRTQSDFDEEMNTMCLDGKYYIRIWKCSLERGDLHDWYYPYWYFEFSDYINTQ